MGGKKPGNRSTEYMLFDASVERIKPRKSRISDFPEVKIDEESSERRNRLIAKFAKLGERFGGLAENRICSPEEPYFEESCRNYERVYQAIEETLQKLGRPFREEYISKAEKLFAGIDRALADAPLAYKVLGEWMEISVSAAGDFVDKVKGVKNNETLSHLCRIYRP
jgi:hypothetical protein